MKQQLDIMQIICTSLQTDDLVPQIFYRPDTLHSWRPANSVKALKARLEEAVFDLWLSLTSCIL